MKAALANSRQALATVGGSAGARVTDKLRKAIALMVWEGHHRDEAAKTAGMLPKSLYNAFRKHHVRRHYLEQLEVLRTSERARNIHALVQVRDQEENKMAVVQAVKALEQMNDNEAAVGIGQPRTPGFVIVIANKAWQSEPATAIEHCEKHRGGSTGVPRPLGGIVSGKSD
jgi:hypothetical protein